MIAAGVDELVRLIGLNKQHVAGLNVVELAIMLDPRGAGKNEYLVLIVVGMTRRVATRLHREMPHRKRRSAIGSSAHQPHGHTLDAVDQHRLGSRRFCASNQHGQSYGC